MNPNKKCLRGIHAEQFIWYARMTMRYIAAVVGLLLVVQSVLVQGAGESRFLLQRLAGGIDHGPVGLDLVSDGLLVNNGNISSGLTLNPSGDAVKESGTCEQTYGFLPCTTSALGNLFLLVVYGYLMFQAATMLSNGSELLLAVMGPGIIGGLFLPVLGAFPDALLILVSGLSGNKETAQHQVLIGIGLLAGSTVMLLTALWGSCLAVGKCDLSESVAVDSQDTKRFSLFGSGISTDVSTSRAAQIMVASLLPFIIVEITLIIRSSSGKRVIILVSCIIAILSLLSYCIYQVLEPWIQKRRIEYAKRKHAISVILEVMQRHKWGRFIKDNGELDDKVIDEIFKNLDDDKDKKLSRGELRGLIVGIELSSMETSLPDAVERVMAEFDTSRDDHIDRKEFENGIRSWLGLAVSTVGHSERYTNKFMSDFQAKSKEELDALLGDNMEDASGGGGVKVYFSAVLLMLGGAIVAALFSDPLVDAVDNFSDATNIPSFFISFIAMPLATNSSEAVSALIFASRKKMKTASLTYSEIYGAVTMNNTLCLGVFLALVYFRDLNWDFSAEVLVILLVVLVMGLLGSFRTTFQLWMSFVAFFLYPLALAIVYVLDYILGWS